MQVSIISSLVRAHLTLLVVVLVGCSGRPPAAAAGGSGPREWALENPQNEARSAVAPAPPGAGSGPQVAPMRVQPVPEKAQGLRYVSLAALQQQALASGGQIPPDVGALAGITRVLGYFIDESNRDVVVFGFVDPAAVIKLHTEDLSVALRNVWMKYAPLRGNTYEYEFPGCSIDPNPDTLRRLDGLGQSTSSESSLAERERQLEQWKQICLEWQAVRVMGAEYDSRFSATEVTADYDMKTLVDGNDVLNLPGFSSLLDLKMELVRAAVARRKPISVSLAGMNRFWFFPGTMRYVEDDGVVWIKQCPVILLTEEMAFGGKGEYGGSGHADPLAQKFTEDFSEMYEKVAQERPIYQDLENLLRFFILAQVIQFKELPHPPELNIDPQLKSGFDLSGLLGPYPISAVPVEKQLRGRSAIKEFKHKETNGNETSTYQLWLQSCGGVEWRHEVKPEEFTHPSPALKRLKAAGVAARPPGNPLFWDLKPDDEVVFEVRNMVALGELNVEVGGVEVAVPDRATLADPKFGYVLPSEPNRRRRVAALVDFKAPAYHLYTDAGVIPGGTTTSSLVQALQNSGAFNVEHLTLKTTGIAGPELAAFRASVRKAAAQVQPDLLIMFVNSDNAEAGTLDVAASLGIALDPPSQLTDMDGLLARKDLSLSFLTRHYGRNEKCNLDILSDRLDVKREFLQSVLRRLPNGHSADSVLRIGLDAKAEAGKKLNVPTKNIPIRCRTKDGLLETGAIVQQAQAQPV